MPSLHTRARKRFGQHFLIRPEIGERIIDLAQLEPDQNALEIGPGRGALTGRLAERANQLLLIEIDRDLAAELRQRHAANPSVRIVEADVLRIDLEEELREVAPVTVVANLPYNISTPLITRLVEWPQLYRRMVLMLQREVAERICAPPGGRDYGSLSVAVQLAAKPRIHFSVPPSAFRPAPKVDSAVISIEPFEKPLLSDAERQAVRRLTRGLFSQRRKQMGKLLRSQSKNAAAILEKLNIDPQRRPETLAPDDFVQITRLIEDNA